MQVLSLSECGVNDRTAYPSESTRRIVDPALLGHWDNSTIPDTLSEFALAAAAGARSHLDSYAKRQLAQRRQRFYDRLCAAVDPADRRERRVHERHAARANAEPAQVGCAPPAGYRRAA